MRDVRVLNSAGEAELSEAKGCNTIETESVTVMVRKDMQNKKKPKQNG